MKEQRQKIILELIKKEKSTTAQNVYAHLSVYHKDEVTVAQARTLLNGLVKEGKLSMVPGHGNVRGSYSLIKGGTNGKS